MTERKRCADWVWHRKSAGQPNCQCRNKALPGKEYCRAHDPESMEAKQRASLALSRKRTRVDTAERRIKAMAMNYARTWGRGSPLKYDWAASDAIIFGQELTDLGRELLAAEQDLAQASKG